MKHQLACADRYQLSPQQRNVSRVTAGVTRCKARALPSSAPHTYRVPLHHPRPALIRVARLITLLPSSGPARVFVPRSLLAAKNPVSLKPLSSGWRPQPAATYLPCGNARARARFGVCTVQTLTDSSDSPPSPSLSSPCSGGLRPGPTHGAGPLICRFETSDPSFRGRRAAAS